MQLDFPFFLQVFHKISNLITQTLKTYSQSEEVAVINFFLLYYWYQTEPSLADIQTTKNVQDALGTLNIQLLDHVIIGSTSNYRSLKEDNYINEEKETYNTEGLNIKLKKQKAQKIQRIMQMER
jgi:hypothetical protein